MTDFKSLEDIDPLLATAIFNGKEKNNYSLSPYDSLPVLIASFYDRGILSPSDNSLGIKVISPRPAYKFPESELLMWFYLNDSAHIVSTLSHLNLASMLVEENFLEKGALPKRFSKNKNIPLVKTNKFDDAYIKLCELKNYLSGFKDLSEATNYPHVLLYSFPDLFHGDLIYELSRSIVSDGYNQLRNSYDTNSEKDTSFNMGNIIPIISSD